MSGRDAAGPPRRVRRWRLRVALGAAVTSLAIALTSSVSALPAGAAMPLVVLQMNLCNSGEAKGCYSFGRAVTEAAATIHRYRPQVVTLQEICRDDVSGERGWGKLAEAMADLYGTAVQVDFTPARNRLTGAAYHCLNGAEYGIAVLHQGTVHDVHEGWYANQSRGGETRAWTCSTVLRDRLTACTTHLTVNKDVALQQCRELMSILATAPWRMPEVIVSADVNLQSEPGQPHDVERCVPPGFERRGDDSVQQVFYSGGVRWIEGRHEPLPGTDHPLLLQSFQV